MSRLLRAAAALLLVTLTGCGIGEPDEAPEESAPSPTIDESQPHTHAPGSEHISSLVGDGTSAHEVGYTLDRVSLPRAAGVPGEVSFRIRMYDGAPLKDYIPEATKELHLYVVRTDLTAFRHLHPARDDDGTWSAPLTLPQPGDYRVITEFVARDEGGNGDFVMLGKTGTVPGDWSPQPADPPAVADDGVVNVGVEGDPEVGDAGQMGIVARDVEGRPAKLGTYLGTFAHVTAFHLASGSVVHLHPLGQPDTAEDGTRLTFHTEFEKPGEYLCFVQVRVDGFLHTLPVGLEVA